MNQLSLNANFDKLQPYPFDRLRALLKNVAPPAGIAPISLTIGEPKHSIPEVIKNAITENFAGLQPYTPSTGSEEFRNSVGRWLEKRFSLRHLDALSQILPVSGTREGLFALGQFVVNLKRQLHPVVVAPNPFYQIYEGAAILAGAEVAYLNQSPELDFALDFTELSEDIWSRVQLLYVCSPGNPTGKVLSLDVWEEIFRRSDQYGFVVAADECYSELYYALAPLGALQASEQLGRNDYRNLLAFGSLSKRSSVPGLRSGYVAGDSKLIANFARYRTYHGCAMSNLIQAASVAAWGDEAHVVENRRLYNDKIEACWPVVNSVLPLQKPEAGFFFWINTGQNDEDFTRKLYAETGVIVLPGSYLARSAHGSNPGEGFVRLALVANLETCLEAVHRIKNFCLNKEAR